jgi:hypothetical protein
MDQILNHRVHPMYSAGSALDYTAQAIGMRYHSDVHPGGVTIDGVPDAISSVAPNWEMVTGNHGTLVVAYLPVIHDIPELAIHTYYTDQEPPSERQNTGDAHTYGVHGRWMTGIPNTDPTVSQPLHHLTARQVIYFDGPNKAVADAQTSYHTAMTDLSLAISAYAGGGTPPDAGTLQFSASSYTITEGNSGSSAATITVTRTGGSAGAVGVSYATGNGTATAGSDYTATNGVLSWADGDTGAKTFTVTVLGDTTVEPDETVNLTLSLPTGGANLGSPATAVLTILNDDTVSAAGSLQFSATNFIVTEGNSGTVNATITVTRTGGSSGSVGVSYGTQDGTAIAGSDYTTRFGTLTWANGDSAPKTFTVPIQGDTTVEPDETVNLLLAQPTGGAVLGNPSTATLTIVNDDGPGAAGTLQFSSATYFHLEGDSGTSLATIEVTRTGGSFGVVGVSFATSDGTATAGFDYIATNGTLSWANGDTAAKTFTVTVLGDTTVEPDETVNLTLSSPTGGATLGTPASATLTIVLDDAPAAIGTLQFSSVSYSTTEGNSGTSAATITVTRTGGSSGAVGVSFATSDGTATAGSDYTATNGVLSWADGDTGAKTFTVTVLGDTTLEGDETVNLTLSLPTGGAGLGTPASATLTILNDDFLPATPSGLLAMAGVPGTINVSWTDNSTNESGFHLERRVSGVGTWSGLAEVGSNVVSYADTNVVAGGRYNYQVRAWNATGPSAYSAPATGTAPGSPAQPSLTLISYPPMSFQFGTTPGRTSLVEYAESLPAPQWILLQTVLGDGSPTTVTDTNTPTGQRYYRVRMP